MDYEKYNNALEKARLRYNEIKDTNCSEEKFLLDLFPELKESEDERIRKGIIDFLWKEKIFLQEAHSSVENNPKYRFVMDAIAWLEKQGEQRKQLIDKACDVLVNCIEDFMLRRMEVWDEECKKQTLENIRKTLEE